MYCRNCGAINNDSASFCNNCGNRLGDPGANINVYNAIANQKTLRQSALMEAEKMVNHFSQKSEQYAEYDRLCERLDPDNRRKRVGLLVWGIIFSVFGLAGLISGIASNSTTNLIIGSIILFGSLMMVFGFAATTRARNKNYEEACARFDELTKELFDHYIRYGDCLVSAEYTNPSNLVAIREVIRSGRADTIKDAVNILIDDAYKYNMEAYAKRNAVAAENASRGATAAAVFCAANFFLKR